MSEDPKSDTAKADEPKAQPQATVQRQVVERTVVREVSEPPLGPNATTDPPDPAEHFYIAADGKTHVNAWGEEKGSPEDKKRFS